MDLINSIVDSFKSDPRNKIIIESKDLVQHTSEEMMEDINSKMICHSISSYESGSSTERDQNILDAAISICHQVADRCWGKCIDINDDEWTEIDISTEWSDYSTENSNDLFVVIRQN